jgi:hypothetical protein
MRRNLTILGGILVFIVLVFVSLASIGLRSIELHMQAIVSSIYEFHEQHGRWPQSTQDLAGTSLTKDFPHALEIIENGAVAVNWPKDLQPRKGANADKILVYHNAGVLTWFGSYVCKGDLSTEYVSWSTVRQNQP